MFQEQINQVVNEISNLQDMQPADLKLLTERYPYCQITQVLLAKKLHSINNPSFEKQLQKTSAIIFDRNVLFEIIENTPLLATAVAGFDHEEEIKPEINQIRHEEIKHDELIPVVEELKEGEIIEPQKEIPVMIHEQISEEVFDQIISDHENEMPENKIEELVQEETKIENIISDQQDIIHQENDLEFEEPAKEEEIQLKEDIIFEEPIKEEEIQLQEKIISEESVLELTELLQSEEPIKEEEIQLQEKIISEEPIMELSELVQSEETIKDEEQIEKAAEKIESDEPLFEMPGYNIERELGTLDEKDEIRIEIQKPVHREEIIEEPIHPAIPIETQRHSFANWFQTIGMQNHAKVVELKAEQMPVRQTVNVKEEEPAQKINEPVKTIQSDVVTEQIAGELAKKSLQFDDRLASETYARILYMQGKYAKAIEMYEKLSLLKPAKSDYFAALIEQIKKRK